ncbi:MAG TPA: hypothetical protein PK748_02905 [Acidimicrobiales bacterium]|nr:hypothetical protein [Acidimicrobiales bacterium]HMS88119.1 hypothetical protein [Acidimicrobiales bacterium]HRA33848.1 hypothetical protein [Acidimicrobiales bacterium]
MSRAPAVRLLVVAVGLGAAAAAARRLRGPATPVFLAPPTAPAGLLRDAPAGSTPRPAEPEPARPEPATPEPATPEPAVLEPAAPEPDTSEGEPAPERPPAPPGERWAFPLDDGRCPPGHPIKAKLRSGLYHEPGMAAYERTHPDRCYAHAVDAEADGLRRAKH